ncbi:MAG: hypothetical protein LC624_03625, partial [Halobacteriales archaeon]|nr:hypothetical protein [Halobacteriales archaeon]
PCRAMARPTVSFGPDALELRFHGVAVLLAAKRRVRVPYAAIASAALEPPRWPPWWGYARFGTNLRGVFCAGTFVGPGSRRLMYFGSRDARVLTLRLVRGLSWYDEVSVALDAPERALQELELRRKR